MTQRKLDILKHFVRYCKKELGIQSLPSIKLTADDEFVIQNRSFGAYLPNENTVKVYWKSRNLADFLRSLAHELTHHRQMELNMLQQDSGETGTDIENEANAMAGILMREYGKINADIYELSHSGNLEEAKKLTPEDETFSAYHGRYLFDVTRAYDLIRSGQVKSIEKTFNPTMLRQFSHPEFSAADPKKVAALKMDYEKPVGILVKFKDPESEQTEWMLIDGNHRVRKASEEDQEAKLYVVNNPEEVEKFMKVDPTKTHKLFPDDDE